MTSSRRLQVQRDSSTQLRRRRRKLVHEHKMSLGCVDCGYAENASALEWDHRPGVEKLGDPSKMAYGPLDKYLEEIAKCDLVCANCHRIRTTDRSEVDAVDAPCITPVEAMDNLINGWNENSGPGTCDECGDEMDTARTYCKSRCRTRASRRNRKVAP